MNYYILKTNELYHHGILGQKWGIRRYQNEDGTLTEAGKEHKQDIALVEENNKSSKAKKAIKIGAIVAGSLLAAYGAYKVAEYAGVNKQIKDEFMPKILDKAKEKYNYSKELRPYFSESYHKEKETRYINEQKKELQSLIKDKIKYNKEHRKARFLDKVRPDMFGPDRTFWVERHNPIESYRTKNHF